MRRNRHNLNSIYLHNMSALEIVNIMNSEDAKIAEIVKHSLPEIAKAVELIEKRLKEGGRLFYVGAGTSGRLGVIDASECPPTFGTHSEKIHGIMAGGEKALVNAIEGVEDDSIAGESIIRNKKIDKRDVIVGISASGKTPFVLAAVEYASKQGAATIGLACNYSSLLTDCVDVGILISVGAEVLADSTRLKAGTAQKMVLNMLSTATMILMGKVYQNRMVDLQVNNKKLLKRALEMVTDLGEISSETAYKLLTESGNHVKTAVVMAKLDINAKEAKQRLRTVDGKLNEII